jgi:Helicase HerA, central domain/TraM recognition site of TraD and TraG
MSLTEIEARVRARHPRLFPAPRVPVPAIDRSALVLGRNEHGAIELIGERARLEHAHVIGTTGSGKSTFLEHCIRQDIRHGRGVCVVDPHGEHPDSLYRSILGWLDKSGYTRTRIIHLIDPNAQSATVGFNPLTRPDAGTDLSVIAGVCLEAFERVWGGEDTQEKPTIRRVLKATFMALAELGLTLAEATLLYDPDDEHGVRAWAVEHVRDRYARDELRRLHQLSLDERGRRDFRMEVVGPINRLAEFVSADTIRTIVGQTERLLDLREALDEGHIILANLSGGSRVYEGDADLLGRLLTRMLFFHAKRRRKPHVPYFMYLDECHRYLSGDLENILAEARKYGVGAVLSHQWLAQLEVESENMLAAVRSATNLKAVFRLKDPVEAQDLAEMVVPLDLEMPVEKLIKPTVVGHRWVKLASESTTEQQSTTDSQSVSRGEGYAETESYVQSRATTFAEGTSSMRSQASNTAMGASQMTMSGSASGMNGAQMMTPDLGVLQTPQIVGLSEGASSSMHSGQGSGSLTSGSP